jgi:protein-L-isoaspartate(D-aspartate) O-methyltransferase
MLSTEGSGEQRSTGAIVAVVMVVAVVGVGLLTLIWGQRGDDPHQVPVPKDESASVVAKQKPGLTEQTRFVEARQEMLEDDLRGRDITDARVLAAMGSVPRQRFVPEDLKPMAYADGPLPIGHGQTISQPYIVALMTQLVQPKPRSKALDVGTGSGYQAAVLAELCKEVYSIEIVEPLADSARERLSELGYDNVTVRFGDGYGGWKEHAPFDVIIVAAAPNHVPQALIDQLAPGGRLVIPVGDYYQELIFIEKQSDGTVRRKSVVGVSFVPMTGKAQAGE